MRKLFIILLSVLSLTAFAQEKKVAVYVTGQESGANKVLGDQLVAAFAKSGRYAAIERTSSFLAELNKEQSYQRSGAVNDNEIARLGVQFGVDYVCVADITEAFGEKYISARLIDVETAEVENTHSVSGEMNSMSACVNMASEIASYLSKGTFEEQAKEARTKADEEAQLRQRKAKQEEQVRRAREAEAKRRAQQEEFEESVDNLGETLVELANVIKDNKHPKYTITVLNYKKSTYKIHFGNEVLGFVNGGKQYTFSVSRKLYGTLTATQANGYLLSPTVITYNVPKQYSNTNITVNIR